MKLWQWLRQWLFDDTYISFLFESSANENQISTFWFHDALLIFLKLMFWICGVQHWFKFWILWPSTSIQSRFCKNICKFKIVSGYIYTCTKYRLYYFKLLFWNSNSSVLVVYKHLLFMFLIVCHFVCLLIIWLICQFLCSSQLNLQKGQRQQRREMSICLNVRRNRKLNFTSS